MAKQFWWLYVGFVLFTAFGCGDKGKNNGVTRAAQQSVQNAKASYMRCDQAARAAGALNNPSLFAQCDNVRYGNIMSFCQFSGGACIQSGYSMYNNYNVDFNTLVNSYFDTYLIQQDPNAVNYMVNAWNQAAMSFGYNRPY